MRVMKKSTKAWSMKMRLALLALAALFGLFDWLLLRRAIVR